MTYVYSLQPRVGLKWHRPIWGLGTLHYRDIIL